MILHTGGLASGATSTRSRSSWRATASASGRGFTPSCLPSASMSRTSRARIRSLTRWSLDSVKAGMRYLLVRARSCSETGTRQLGSGQWRPLVLREPGSIHAHCRGGTKPTTLSWLVKARWPGANAGGPGSALMDLSGLPGTWSGLPRKWTGYPLRCAHTADAVR